jgi:hypothetical protein
MSDEIDITTNNGGNCKISSNIMIYINLLKYHCELLCVIDDWPSTNVRDADATKGQGNRNTNRN